VAERATATGTPTANSTAPRATRDVPATAA